MTCIGSLSSHLFIVPIWKSVIDTKEWTFSSFISEHLSLLSVFQQITSNFGLFHRVMVAVHWLPPMLIQKIQAWTFILSSAWSPLV